MQFSITGGDAKAFGISLLNATFDSLMQRRSSTSTVQSSAVIDAIMILKTKAYKFSDSVTHETYARGLLTASEHRAQDTLTTQFEFTTPVLPAGFVRYQSMLPSNLLDCVSDLTETKLVKPILV